MAGGEGKRLKPVTGPLPKPMVPLLGKPLMEHIILLLRDAGITEICAALGYNPRAIVDYFGDGSRLGVHLEYRFEKEPLGTAGGVKNCSDFFKEEDFIVISGDAACDFDLRFLTGKHKKAGAGVTMALFESPEPLSYGLVIPEPDGKVRCFIEKPGWDRVVTNLVNTGIYVISSGVMALVPEGAPFDFAKDLFPLLMAAGKDDILGVVMSGYWCDVGTPRAYYKCCLDALDGRLRLYDVADSQPPVPQPRSRPPLAGSARCVRHIACRDRARLMRAVTECMMEFGADFSDGLTLCGDRCGLRVYPASEASEVVIETASGDRSFSAELAAAMEHLATELEQTAGIPHPSHEPEQASKK